MILSIISNSRAGQPRTKYKVRACTWLIAELQGLMFPKHLQWTIALLRHISAEYTHSVYSVISNHMNASHPGEITF